MYGTVAFGTETGGFLGPGAQCMAAGCRQPAAKRAMPASPWPFSLSIRPWHPDAFSSTSHPPAPVVVVVVPPFATRPPLNRPVPLPPLPPSPSLPPRPPPPSTYPAPLALATNLPPNSTLPTLTLHPPNQMHLPFLSSSFHSSAPLSLSLSLAAPAQPPLPPIYSLSSFSPPSFTILIP